MTSRMNIDLEGELSIEVEAHFGRRGTSMARRMS